MVSRRVKLALWWRNGGTWWKFAFFALLLILLFGFIYFQQSDEEIANSGSSLLVFLFVNLNIIILSVFGFLIARNIVKLVFDRKQNILGSKLRLRLVSAFVGLALIPTTILFILASGLLTSALEGWFSKHVENAVSGAVEVARLHHRQLIGEADTLSQKLIKDLIKVEGLGRQEQERLIEKRREAYQLYSIKLLRNNSLIISAQSAAQLIDNFKEPEPDENALNEAWNGRDSLILERREASQFVRAYKMIKFEGEDLVLVLTSRVDPELTRAVESINSSYKDYERLKLYRSPLRSGYILTFAMITGLIIFSAIWIGFYIAKDISVPIQRIAEGTTELAKGNYNFQIRVSGSDELGLLARSFNKMIKDLKYSRETAESHRLFIEAILANLAVGVIAMDREMLVFDINQAAKILFSVPQSSERQREYLKNLVGEEFFKQLEPLIIGFLRSDSAEDGIEGELILRSQGSERRIICRIDSIREEINLDKPAILIIFEDITELLKAQQMSAWREVARRIAHEIKNPLTPIQLSAQRLEKLIGQSENSQTIAECTQAIVKNVDSIKRLANEFSNFARMPTAQYEDSDLNSLISETVATFASNNSEIVFQFIPDDKLPSVLMDREQMRRVLINFLDNSIDACKALSKKQPALGLKIVLKTDYDRKRRSAIIEISDNGEGIPDNTKGRIFDPYFTTKKSGTGLGLAIVTSIISDHQGNVRVYDNHPQGTKFIIEVALAPSMSIQRRGSTAV